MSRLEELRAFAQTWLGRELTPSDAVAVPTASNLPAALREIYQTFGAVSQLTTPHNRLLGPSEIVSDSGYRIFYDENQGVVRWAFRDSDCLADNPIVYQGISQEDGYGWFSEDTTISDWIRVMTLWQIVNGGYEFGSYASGIEGAAGTIQSHYPFVGGHADGTTRFYGTPGRLICLAGPDTIPSVWAAGATPEDLAELSSALDFDWDYSSADD